MAMSRSLGGTWFTTRPTDRDLALGDLLEPGDHPQQGGLAAARRTDQHHELAVGDVDLDAVQDVHATEILVDLADLDRSHLPLRRGAGAVVRFDAPMQPAGRRDVASSSQEFNP